jgi:hypothetical protein
VITVIWAIASQSNLTVFNVQGHNVKNKGYIGRVDVGSISSDTDFCDGGLAINTCQHR